MASRRPLICCRHSGAREANIPRITSSRRRPHLERSVQRLNRTSGLWPHGRVGGYQLAPVTSPARDEGPWQSARLQSSASLIRHRAPASKRDHDSTYSDTAAVITGFRRNPRRLFRMWPSSAGRLERSSTTDQGRPACRGPRSHERSPPSPCRQSSMEWRRGRETTLKFGQGRCRRVGPDRARFRARHEPMGARCRTR